MVSAATNFTFLLKPVFLKSCEVIDVQYFVSGVAVVITIAELVFKLCLFPYENALGRKLKLETLCYPTG